MYLSSLSLKDYRNYKRLECALCPGINIFTGPNAQGKTNLIEAIYYLSIGKAYRQARDEELIRWGGDSFLIKGEAGSRPGKIEIEVCYNRAAKPGKEVRANGLKQQKWEAVSGLFTSVLFSPESMSVIKGAPQERRGFLDHDLGQISPAYSADVYRYRRLLAQRNALLKKVGFSRAPMTDIRERLSLWDKQLIHYGSRIVEKRLDFLEKMTPLARLAHRKLTHGKENLEIQYVPYSNETPYPAGVAISKDYNEISGFLTRQCEISLEDDLRYKSTRWGPHRDDVSVLLDGKDMRKYGSQGQQRTGALALKLAEIEVFRGSSGEYPVLLLDDVLSELDGQRQEQLLDIITDRNIQCVVTATELGNVRLPENRQIRRFSVSDGEIRVIYDS